MCAKGQMAWRRAHKLGSSDPIAAIAAGIAAAVTLRDSGEESGITCRGETNHFHQGTT